MSDAEEGVTATSDSITNADTLAISTNTPSAPSTTTQPYTPLKPRNPNAAPIKILAPAPNKYDFKKKE